MKILGVSQSDKKLTQSFSEETPRSTENSYSLCVSPWNEFSIVK